MAIELLLRPLLLLPFVHTSLGLHRLRGLQYHLKFFIYYFSVSLVSVLMLPLCLLRPRNVLNSLACASILRHVAWLLGVQFELIGGAHLAKPRGCVVVANHQSTLDILGMYNIWSVCGRVATVAKKELLFTGPFGVSAWLSGVVFINRSTPKLAYQQLSEAGKLCFKSKTKLWVYPEGTRNLRAYQTRELLPFKNGAFLLAIQAQVPIVPVVFSPYYFIDADRVTFGKGKVMIKALPAVNTKGLTAADLEPLTFRIKNLMLEEFTNLAKKNLETTL